MEVGISTREFLYGESPPVILKFVGVAFLSIKLLAFLEGIYDLKIYISSSAVPFVLFIFHNHEVLPTCCHVGSRCARRTIWRYREESNTQCLPRRRFNNGSRRRWNQHPRSAISPTTKDPRYQLYTNPTRLGRLPSLLSPKRQSNQQCHSRPLSTLLHRRRPLQNTNQHRCLRRLRDY